MKSLKEYSLNLSEAEYHAYPAWSYSLISRYAKDGFSAIATLHDKTEPTPSMEFGSFFDAIITRGIDGLKDYIVLDAPVPDAEKKVLDELAKTAKAPFSEILVEDVLKAADAVKYQSNWKPQTRYDHIEVYKEYFDTVASGKKIVSREDWNDATAMYTVFKNDSYLKSLFGRKSTADVEYIYQAQFETEWIVEGEHVKIKIMPDLLIVNHKDKTIQPVDLKTSSQPAYQFGDNFIKFRYDIQAELYTDVLKKICFSEGPATEYADYTILPYLFTDISRSDKVPVTFEYDPTNGFSYTSNGREYRYKGWYELLSEILAYEATDAKVPSNIITDGPNNLINLLNK